MAFIAAVAAHMGTPALLCDLLAAITIHPAAMLRRPQYGLGPGCRADVVAWACERPEEVVATLPARTLVMKDGRVTVEHEARVTEPWRA
jgi:cytosine deaminase